jgi:guanylate kinase
MKKGQLIILSGPSGVGKGTIREKLFQNENLNLAYSISMTTRTPREGEVDGQDYFFISEAEFQEKIKDGLLIEWAQFVGNYYGTPKEYVEQLLNEGKNVVLEIEVQGANQVMAMFPKAITIFIVPPSIEELESRIRGRRSEPEDVVAERLNKAKYELTLTNQYRYVVENNDVDTTVKEIEAIIKNNI